MRLPRLRYPVRYGGDYLTAAGPGGQREIVLAGSPLVPVEVTPDRSASHGELAS